MSYNRTILHKNYGYSPIFAQNQTISAKTGGQNACQSFRIRVIFLLASRLLLSTTFMYLWVVVILL